MWKNIGYEQCLSYINCQLRPDARYLSAIRPAITISRMTGSGGRTIASNVAEHLQNRAPVDCHWTVFDRNLVETVLEDHHLPKRIAEYIPEDHKSMLGDALEELLGLHPSSWTIVHQTAETILRLAHLGFVILVGRGANVVTRKLDNVFHVRLVGSLERRTERVQQVYDLNRHDALEFIRKEDKGRRRYLKDNYGENIDDPLLYDLVINTNCVGYEDAARLIGDEVIHRYKLQQGLKAAAA